MSVPRTIAIGIAGVAFMTLSAFCLAWACPPYNIRVLAMVGLAMCCITSLLYQRGLYPTGLGLYTGLLMGVLVIGRDSDYTAFANMLPIFGTVGFNLGITCWLICWAKKRLPITSLWWFIPTAAAATEFAGAHMFPVSLAVTQHTSAWACQLAGVTGQWGISWVLWLAPSALVMGIITRKHWLTAVGVALFVFTSLPFTPKLVSVPGYIGVAAVQAPGERTAAEITMTLPKDIRYVVWPEQVQLYWDATTRQTAMRSGKYISGSFEREIPKQRSTNSARLYAPSGKLVLVTDKYHLFGKEVLQYQKGNSNRAVEVAPGVRIAVPICFDMVYPDVPRKLARGGATLLMVPNSDPDSPDHAFHKLHIAMVRLRAAENRIPIVWSEVSSFSSVIDASGAVIKQAGMNEETAVTAKIRPGYQRTLYTRFGDWFAWVCVAVTLGLLGFKLALRVKKGLKWVRDLKLR